MEIAVPRSDAQFTLHPHLTTLQLPSLSDDEDCFSWVINEVIYAEYSSSKTWDAIRPREVTKDWSGLVWFKGCVPKHAFNMWISHLNRLSMRVRLDSWGMNISTVCCLCSRGDETRDHIFLNRVYTLDVWRLVMARLNNTHHLTMTWSELMSWIRRGSSQSPSLLRIIATQAMVFHIWKQRNNVLHNLQSIPGHIINARRHRQCFGNLMSFWLRQIHNSTMDSS